MSIIENPNGISLSSYSKNQWGKLLAETAYCGFKVNEISQRFKEGYACTFENDHLINLISSKGKERITVDMNDVRKKYDHWTFSRLFHNFRMLFTHSAYALEFNERITKLAETLTIQSRKQNFHRRCQANLGNFVTLPSDIHDQIIYAMPTQTKEDELECIEHMKKFWKAPLGNATIFKTIDLKKFANWINTNRCTVFKLNLIDEDLKSLFPYIEYLRLNSEEFNFDFFDIIGTCKNLKILDISNSNDLIDDHLKYIFNLPKLKQLNISNCSKITDDGLKWISAPSKLSKLDLRKCKITDEGLRFIKKLTNLTDLNLYECYISKNESIKHLAKLTHLEYLTLVLKKEGFKHLEKLPSLKGLILGEIMDEDLEPLGKIANLCYLLITNSHMTGAGLQYLTKLSNFQTLYLHKCTDITNENLNYITQMKKFRYLNVYNCQNLTIQYVEKLDILIEWTGYNSEGCMKHYIKFGKRA